ncbi:hypothetical protein G7046_g5753 [Stylonectria norvegica]|nr:hypothetical protein G7046_g5753 [Stylonectria norvegica]
MTSYHSLDLEPLEMPPEKDPPPQGYSWVTTLVPTQPTDQHEHLLKYDDESSSMYKDFQYTRLENLKHRIRLLKLRPGQPKSDAEVACELFDAEFQDQNGGQLVGVVSQEVYTYEALTWCWGIAPADSLIFIEEKSNKRTEMAVSSDLAWALKHLRKPDKSRILWIDAICIDQKNIDERNDQVQVMSKIYSYSSRVCVWLGLDDPNSRKAIAFIRDEILQLQRFDELCDDESNAQKWQALLVLMQRPWFFRRWVVQEISLAKDAVIHCGPDQIPWNDFCVAVELFVEVETATHRLSEVIKKDPKFYHVPGWFDYVSALGASLLVQATTMIFRQYQPESLKKRRNEGIQRQETFLKTPQPNRNVHDTDSDDYSLDSSESVDDESSENDTRGFPTRSKPRNKTSPPDDEELLDPMSSRSPLLSLEYLVSKLSIFETTEPRDAIYAFLAIAKDTLPEALIRVAGGNTSDEKKHAALSMFQKKEQKLFPVNYDRPYAEVCQNFMEFCIKNSTLPGSRARALDILCRPRAPNPSIGFSRRKARRVMLHSVIDSTCERMDERLKLSATQTEWKQPATTHTTEITEREMDGRYPGALKQFMEKYHKTLYKKAKLKEEEGSFPSWIPRLDGAPFYVCNSWNAYQEDVEAKRRPPDLEALRFNKLYLQDAYCMHIPKKWMQLGGWDNAGDPQRDKGPPDEFWRTLVADRGVNARNPPSFYERACKESAAKGGLAGGTISTSDFIYNERNSIVVQFCRRVQEVIWNKRLIVTRDGYLGIASERVHKDDLVVILYGASVPVILRKKKKTAKQMEMERAEVDLFRKLEMMKRRVRYMADKRRQKRFFDELPEEPTQEDIQRTGRQWGKRKVREDLDKWKNEQLSLMDPTNLPRRARSKTSASMEEHWHSAHDSIGSSSPSGEAEPSPTVPAKRVDSGTKTEPAKTTVSEHYYKFLGECYIHGMMDGEAVKWKMERAGNRRREDDPVFELR